MIISINKTSERNFLDLFTYKEIHIETLHKTCDLLYEDIQKSINIFLETFKNGNRVFICGNGGSASDSEHFSTELLSSIGEIKRVSLPVVSLVSNLAFITAHSNDFSFTNIFSRQLEALASKNDLLVAFTTSGKSENVLNAIKTALGMKMKVIVLTGEFFDLNHPNLLTLKVQSSNTQIIQETHILLYHFISIEINKVYLK